MLQQSMCDEIPDPQHTCKRARDAGEMWGPILLVAYQDPNSLHTSIEENEKLLLWKHLSPSKIVG